MDPEVVIASSDSSNKSSGAVHDQQVSDMQFESDLFRACEVTNYDRRPSFVIIATWHLFVWMAQTKTRRWFHGDSGSAAQV